MEQEVGGFLSFSWVLAHGFWRCRGFDTIFLEKLHKIVCNKSAKSSCRPDVHATSPKSILWVIKQEIGDFLSFSQVLAHGIWRCRGSEPIFLEKLYENVCNEAAKSSCRPNVHSTSPKNILWAMEHELVNFFNFSWVLAHGFWRCRGSKRVFPKKHHEIIYNDVPPGPLARLVTDRQV